MHISGSATVLQGMWFNPGVSSPPAVPPDTMHSYHHRDVGLQTSDVKDHDIVLLVVYLPWPFDEEFGVPYMGVRVSHQWETRNMDGDVTGQSIRRCPYVGNLWILGTSGL